MRVGIVGGTGNISSSLVRVLLELGHEVTCFNRDRTGGLAEGARLIPGDRNDADAFEQTMRRERFDAAIDMICFDAEQARSSMRAFRDVGHVVVCSTVAAYDVDWQWLPVTEDHPLTTREETDAFMEKHGVETTPQTWIGDERIGGYDDLRVHFGLDAPESERSDTYYGCDRQDFPSGSCYSSPVRSTSW